MISLLTLILSSPDGSPNPSSHLFLIAGVFIIMYFFMIRPQSKKAKEARTFMEGLQKGDKVVTIGGIHGKILKADDTSVLLAIDVNTKVRVEKTAISHEYTKLLNSGKSTTTTTEEKEKPEQE
ncbi:MAG: preprotein translocase subunit YajC [Sphingobacteriales bacterium]|nr:MAG: preprotein translocase subunit YajC [Sphingobacteriales bacterium]